MYNFYLLGGKEQRECLWKRIFVINCAYSKKFDVGISYCFPRIINLSRSDKPWFNYHPAPLPEYKGLECYVQGIKDGVSEWGVTLHRMVQQVDSGRILAEKRFHLESLPVDINELGNIAHYYLFQLFKQTIDSLENLDEDYKTLKDLKRS